MADEETVRRLAMGLPGMVDESAAGRFSVAIAGGKGVAWTYLAREAPKKPRLARPGIVAIRCEMARKELLIEAAPDRFFDDDHYHGYPAVLVRLEAIEEDELAHLLYESWRLQAPKSVQKRHTL